MTIEYLFKVMGIAALCAPVVAIADDLPVEFSRIEAEQHLIPPPDLDLYPLAGDHRVDFDVLVGIDGRVASLTPIGGEVALAQDAGHFLKGLAFKPFAVDGHPVRARLKMSAPAPDEKTNQVFVPFPEITNPQSLSISLHRSSCYGACPDYVVEIRGDGKVTFSGNGTYTGQASSSRVATLVKMLRNMEFFSLKDRYTGKVTDMPTYTVTVTVGDRTKRIVDYAGRMIFMPDSLTDLENMIDFAADTSKWLSNKSYDLQNLKAGGFDFSSVAGSDILLKVADIADLEAVLEFEHAGALLRDGENARKALSSAAGRGKTDIVVHMLDHGIALGAPQAMAEALYRAASGGYVKTAEALIAAGADPRGGSEGSPIIFAAARSRNAEMVELILKYHPDLTKTVSGITSAGEVYETAVGEALSGNPWRQAPAPDLARIVRDLGEAGAEMNVRTFRGPLLTRTTDRTVIKALLDFGADPNAEDSQGGAPLDAVPTEELAILMIQRGANFNRPSRNGITIVERAQAYHWQRVLDLIAAKSGMSE